MSGIKRLRHMIRQRGSDEWKRGAIYSRTESEKLHVKVKEKEERREVQVSELQLQSKITYAVL
jgi:hypothetical protein